MKKILMPILLSVVGLGASMVGWETKPSSSRTKAQ